MGGYIKFIQLNYRSTSINVIVYFLIILTLYVTSVKMATWLADTRSKANTFLHLVIFQEISPEKLGMHLLCTLCNPHIHISGIFLISVPSQYWVFHSLQRTGQGT